MGSVVLAACLCLPRGFLRGVFATPIIRYALPALVHLVNVALHSGVNAWTDRTYVAYVKKYFNCCLLRPTSRPIAGAFARRSRHANAIHSVHEVRFHPPVRVELERRPELASMRRHGEALTRFPFSSAAQREAAGSSSINTSRRRYHLVLVDPACGTGASGLRVGPTLQWRGRRRGGDGGPGDRWQRAVRAWHVWRHLRRRPCVVVA